MKTMPKDYEQLLHLSEIKNWNMYNMIERIVNIKGFYSCMYEDKKTVIVV